MRIHTDVAGLSVKLDLLDMVPSPVLEMVS